MANTKLNPIQVARQYLDSLVIESRIIGAEKPTSKVNILGQEFDTPIMTGALSHLKPGMAGLAQGAKLAGALCSVGMGDNDSLGEVLATGAKVVKVIKPYADKEEILSRLQFAKEHGAFGVGMDVEHAVDPESDRESTVAGYQMKLPSMAELREYISYTGLPFFIKGALSVQDAVRAKELGAAGVILSHHNGIMRCAVPPCALLKDIRKAVGGELILIADGGIEDGFYAFKALALGADLVCVGRPLMKPYDEEGPEGVSKVINTMTEQLKAMLLRTGSASPAEIDPEVIHEAWWIK